MHTRSYCVERQRARSLVCFRGWSSWGTSVDQSSFVSHHSSTEQTLLEDFPAFCRELFRGALCLDSLVSVLFFDFLVCIDAHFFLIYVNSFISIKSSLWKFREFFECISVKSFNGIVNYVIRSKSSVIGYSRCISEMKICNEISLQKNDVFEEVYYIFSQLFKILTTKRKCCSKHSTDIIFETFLTHLLVIFQKNFFSCVIIIIFSQNGFFLYSHKTIHICLMSL